jgi:hypothetical protein
MNNNNNKNLVIEDKFPLHHPLLIKNHYFFKINYLTFSLEIQVNKVKTQFWRNKAKIVAKELAMKT